MIHLWALILYGAGGPFGLETTVTSVAPVASQQSCMEYRDALLATSKAPEALAKQVECRDLATNPLHVHPSK